MKDIFGWVNFAFGLLSAVAGVIVVRGVFHRTLSSASAVRFLRWSLVASLAGLMPLTRHLSLLQNICMLSVYCSGAAIVAWRRFGLVGRSRQVFAVAVTAVLYFDVDCVLTGLFRNSPLFPAQIAQPPSLFQLLQVLVAAAFIVIGILAVRECRIDLPNGNLRLRGI